MIAMVFIAIAVVIVGVALANLGGRSAAPRSSTEQNEGHALADSAVAAVEDVAGPFLGVDAHPTAPEALARRVP